MAQLPSNCIDSKVSFTAESRSVANKTIYGLDSSSCSVSSPDPQISNLCKNNIDGINGGTSCLTNLCFKRQLSQNLHLQAVLLLDSLIGVWLSAQCSKDAVDGSVKTLISTQVPTIKLVFLQPTSVWWKYFDGIVQLTLPNLHIPEFLNCQTARDFLQRIM